MVAPRAQNVGAGRLIAEGPLQSSHPIAGVALKGLASLTSWLCLAGSTSPPRDSRGPTPCRTPTAAEPRAPATRCELTLKLCGHGPEAKHAVYESCSTHYGVLITCAGATCPA